jgi:hypothetical protein
VGDKVAASEGNDDFDLEKFILEETRRRRRDVAEAEEDVKIPDAQAVSPTLSLYPAKNYKFFCPGTKLQVSFFVPEQNYKLVFFVPE